MVKNRFGKESVPSDHGPECRGPERAVVPNVAKNVVPSVAVPSDPVRSDVAPNMYIVKRSNHWKAGRIQKPDTSRIRKLDTVRLSDAYCI